MPLTSEFKNSTMARAKRDRTYREGLLRSGCELMLAGDSLAGRLMLRDYINAIVGFEVMAKDLGMSSKSLMRMFGPTGNPRTDNLLKVISYLQEQEGVDLRVEARRVI